MDYKTKIVGTSNTYYFLNLNFIMQNQSSYAKLRTNHGMYNNRIYKIYYGIKNRCSNQKFDHYNRYGGRGIKNEFESFQHFFETMGSSYKDGLTIDRIDNDGNYSPQNCKWSTKSTQARNRRTTVMYNDRPLIDICEEKGLAPNVVYGRIRKGWDIEKALNTPLMQNQHSYK